MSTLKYRADIDGLRALAVLSVIIFHLNTQWLQNGFLGVDVFFVLSGFLISTIIYKEVQSGDFSYKRFYMRRIKRILPVFFVVLLVGLCLAQLIMIPDTTLEEVHKSSISSIFFAANIFFMRGGGGYFSIDSDLKPFLHVWSLSVEEQFYFLFPSVLIAIVRGKPLYTYRYWIVAGLCILCLVSPPLQNLILMPSSKWDVYYQPHIRFGEMLVGALLAMLLADGYGTSISQHRASLYSVIALAILLISLFIPNIFTPPYFPGLVAVVPCVAAAVLIYTNKENHLISKLFALSPIVWIGKLSYSLYLWHWVVLAYMRMTLGAGELDAFRAAIASVITLALSCLTYYYVEQPIRNKEYTLLKASTKYYILPSIGVVLICLFHPFTHKNKLDVTYNPTSFPGFDNNSIHSYLGDSTRSRDVLVIGDSHTQYAAELFDWAGKREGWQARLSAGAASAPFFGYSNELGNFCIDRNNEFERNYRNYKTVIMPLHWGNYQYREREDFIPKMRTTLKALTEANIKVVLIRLSYRTAVDARLYEAMQIRWGFSPYESYIRYGFGEDLKEKDDRHAEKIRQIVQTEFPNIRWLDFSKYLPENEIMYQGKAIRTDDNHPNAIALELYKDGIIKDQIRLLD